MLTITMPTLPGTKPNVVAGVFAKAGDDVKAGQELFSVETSKRAVPIPAPADGTVSRVHVKAGDVVAAGDVLAEMEGAPSCAPDAGTDKEDARPDARESHAQLLVIGGGVGGYVAALYAAKMGKDVTLVERAELGGTCLNRGCIPTKSLIASARMRRSIVRAAEWGLTVEGGVRPDMGAIMARKNRVVRELTEGVAYLMEQNRVHVLRASARFDGNDAVIVSFPEGGHRETRLSFDDCIVATGSAIRELDLPGADLPEVLDTDRALAATTLPKSIVVVGGGVTGTEFAFIYADLGVKVTLVARRDRLLHVFDEDASKAVMRSAAARGIHVEVGADVKRFERLQDGSVRTVFEARGERRYATSDYVLVAGGRVPLTEGLGLETTDIALDAATGAVAVDGRMRTSVEHIYAVGDVNGRVMLAHAASYQGRLAVDDIRGKGGAFRSEIIPSVAYTDPEVASVGVGVDEARRHADRFAVGSFSFAHNGKALAENAPEGFVSLVSDTDGVLRGATIVGSHASELIGSMGLAISAEMTGDEARGAVFAHPTTSEALHEAACDLAFGALHE